MKITVLGSFGPYPPAGGTCPGYLLEEDGCFVLLDCGNGVLSHLQHYISIKDISAVILSHLHSDHISDVFILRYAWQAEMAGDAHLGPLPVYAPFLPEEEFERLPYKEVLKVEAVPADGILRIGPFEFSFLQTIHSVLCYAVKAEVKSGEKLVYTADTGYFPQLTGFSVGADILLSEANYLEDDLHEKEATHMSAGQAASLALEAEAKALLLTHLPANRDPLLHLREARRVFSRVQIAEEGFTYSCDGNNAGNSVEEAPPDGEWVELIIETNPIKLSLLEGRLRAEGIPVIISGEALAGVYGLTTGPLAERKILIPPQNEAEAKEILNSIATQMENQD